MVSSSQVNSDLGNIKSNLVNYDNYIDELGSSWKGASYDNLVVKAEDFSTEFTNSLSSQMTSFASACELYENYKTTKKSIETVTEYYNDAVANNDSKSASYYEEALYNLNNTLSSLKTQIENALSSASSVKLEATSITSTAAITSAAAGSGNGVALDSQGNLANPYIIHASGVHTDGLAPAMKVRIDKLATKYYELTGNQLKITSGSRTMEEQQALYNQYGSSRAASPNPKAPHIAGVAIDIDPGQADWLAKNGILEECGLSRPLLNWGSSGGTNEPWHIEIDEWRESNLDIEYINSLTE